MRDARRDATTRRATTRDDDDARDGDARRRARRAMRASERVERSATSDTTTTETTRDDADASSPRARRSEWTTTATTATRGRGSSFVATALTGLTIEDDDGRRGIARGRRARGETSEETRGRGDARTRTFRTSNEDGDEETLEIENETLTRRAGGVVRGRWSCEEKATAATRCAFKSDGERRGWFWCALHRDSFSLFGENGEMRRMPIGFEACALAATREGVLFVASDGGGVALVAHALDEPTPVEGLSDGVFVAWSDPQRSDVLFYAHSRRALELWTITLVPARSETEFSDAVPEFVSRADLRWSEGVGDDFAADAATYSLAHDENGREIILVSDNAAQRVCGLYVDADAPGGHRASGAIEGTSAMGVSGTRKGDGMLDTLVVCVDGTLALCIGTHLLCKLDATTPDGESTAGDVQFLSDSVGSGVTVHTSRRGSMRVRVPGSLASPHARALFAVLREVCSQDDFLDILRRMYASECVGADDAEAEWAYFVQVLQAWCEIAVKPRAVHELDDWEFSQRLLKVGVDSLSARTSDSNVNATRASVVLDAVHTIYEASKVDLLTRCMLKPLREFAMSLVDAIGTTREAYADYYARDSGASIAPLSVAAAPLQVPDLLRAVEGIFTGQSDFHTLVPPLILAGLEENAHVDANTFGGDVVVRARRVVKLCHVSTLGATNSSTSGGALACAMVDMGFTLEDLERLPPGLSLPFHGILRRCRDSPANGWPVEAYKLIGRQDLALMHGDDDFIRDERQRRVSRAPAATTRIQPDSASVSDGLEHLEEFVGPLRFPRDYRIRELRSILSTATPVPIQLDETEGAGGDAEQGSQQQSKLWLLAARTAAMPVGRGAASLGTVIAKPTEALLVPTLCLAGCLPTQQYAVVNLDLTAADAPKDFVNWPEFHNGAAAGLALRSDDDSGKLTRAWIVFNRPKLPTFSHAGVLMAFGLNGHLSSLTATDLYRYLAQEHEATTVGTLLGVAASKLGTGDSATSRMCFLHLPTRHPMSFPEIELPSLVQSCALLSVGLLYQGTAQRLIVETLLSELGKSPEGDVINGRECYALSAGIALGLVTLGRGHSASGLSDLHIAERLRHFIVGGVARHVPPPGGVPSSSAARKSTSGAAGWQESYPSDDAWTNSTGGVVEDQTASVDGYILEGSMVNVDLSAPGAIMALGLMYLKTNDASVSAHLEIPSTHYGLDDARPDYVMLRVVAKSLIMWDTVEPSASWIEGLLPPLLRDAMDVKSPEEQEAQNDSSWLGEADREAIAQTYVNVLAGGCMSIGLRFAGSSNPDASATLRHYAFKFLEWKKKVGQDGGEPLVNKSMLETCIGIVAMALSCVMAGTGDLPTLRLLRHLRSRMETSASANTGLTYGAHMAIGLANGFLFLGAGAQTFSTDDASIAALLISMFPRFPSDPNDNRWYCQAYRHLYALAAKDRLLHTIDATTLQPVSSPVEITTVISQGKETTMQLITPCLLPDPAALASIKIISPRYWSIHLDFALMHADTKDALYKRRNIPIQRHTAALSYEIDRTGAKAQLATALHAAGARAALKPPSAEASIDHNTAPVANATAARAGRDAVDVFTSDAVLLAFARHMGDGASDRAGFTAAALRECMHREVPDALRTYVDMYASCEALIHSTENSEARANAAALAVNDLRLLSAFSELLKRSGLDEHDVETTFPMPTLLVSSFKQTISLVLDSRYGDQTVGCALAKYLRGEGYDASIDTYGRFGCYLRLLDVPTPRVLRSAIETGMNRLGASDLSVASLRACLPDADPSTVLRIIETCLP